MQLHSGRRPTVGAGRVVRNAESASVGHLPALARSDDRPTFPQVATVRFRQNVNFCEGPPPVAMQLHSGYRPTIGAGRVVRNTDPASSAILYESTKRRPGSPFPHLGKCRSVVDSYKTRRPRRPRRPAEHTSGPDRKLVTQHLRDEEGQLESLLGVQSGVAGGLVAARQVDIGDVLGATEAFGDVLAGELDVDAARVGA